jgi:phospholipid-binding lipoprotein MlaA
VIGAAQAAAATPDDPFEHLNRQFFASTQGADQHLVLPLARLFHALTPGPIGEALHNFVTNLAEPMVVANDVLQARLGHAVRDTARIVLDTTVGLGGLIDVAAPAGLPHHDNDFGITLGRWGVAPGPYIFLPLLGPSTVRDAIGEGADAVMNPLNFVRFHGRLTLEVSSSVVAGLDRRIRSQGDMDALLSDAADPYATLRSVYLQDREAAVRGESAPPVLPPIDDESPAAPAPTQPSQPSAEAPAPAAGMAATAVPTDPQVADLDRPLITAQPWDRVASPVTLATAGG